ncbi:MAG: hypothetical protein ACPLZH_02450 [Minisyncoccales bacterium]
MRRVYLVWFLRQILPTIAGMVLSLGLALWLVAKEFFVAKIIENFIIALHAGNVFSYLFSAVYHAPFFPLVFIVLLLAIFIIASWRLLRNIFPLSLVKV